MGVGLGRVADVIAKPVRGGARRGPRGRDLLGSEPTLVPDLARLELDDLSEVGLEVAELGPQTYPGDVVVDIGGEKKLGGFPLSMESSSMMRKVAPGAPVAGPAQKTTATAVTAAMASQNLLTRIPPRFLGKGTGVPSMPFLTQISGQ